ncbi:MAG: peptidoglycan DD-metalloendopeptidase family protein [Halothiobacillaceae bacterium]
MHVVRRGDTLYSIAVANNTDYRALARWNGIRDPSRIYVGQRIRLTPPASATRPSAEPTPAKRPEPKPATASKPQPDPSPRPEPKPASTGPFAWQWPADGKVTRRFSSSAPVLRGIDISGKTGDPVRAAGAGEVVYAGDGLPGYGNLLIVKHDPRHLSAYAFNRKLMVAEGERVRAGQQIATMGRDGSNPPALHFQIRLDGKPVDPMRFLPPR